MAPEVLPAQSEGGSGDPADVHRSVRRYIWQTLGGQPWTVRLQRTRVSDDKRPVAFVDPGVLTTPQARATINQGDVQKQQPFTVVAYPELGDTAPVSAEIARELASLLDAGITRGLVTDDDPPLTIGAPFRIPIYSFTGIAIEGPDREGPSTPYMYANVDSTFNVRPIQDALDELRYTVVATLRVSWWAGGRIPPVTPIATAMPGTWLPGVQPTG